MSTEINIRVAADETILSLDVDETKHSPYDSDDDDSEAEMGALIYKSSRTAAKRREEEQMEPDHDGASSQLLDVEDNDNDVHCPTSTISTKNDSEESTKGRDKRTIGDEESQNTLMKRQCCRKEEAATSAGMAAGMAGNDSFNATKPHRGGVQDPSAPLAANMNIMTPKSNGTKKCGVQEQNKHLCRVKNCDKLGIKSHRWMCKNNVDIPDVPPAVNHYDNAIYLPWASSSSSSPSKSSDSSGSNNSDDDDIIQPGPNDWLVGDGPGFHLMNGNFKRTVSKDCDNSDEEKKKKKQVNEAKKEEELEATKMKMASAQLKLDGTTPNSPFPIKMTHYDKNWDKHFQALKVCTYITILLGSCIIKYSPTSLSISLFPNPNSLSSGSFQDFKEEHGKSPTSLDESNMHNQKSYQYTNILK